jgi:hypothetical protein
MKLGLLANLGRALAFCLLAAPAASAQDAPAPRPKPDKLVVQVVFRKDAKPSYLDVPDCAWYGWFGSTPAAAARPASETVHAVDVKAKLEGGRVELKVGVHVGGRFFDRLDEVATYSAALGETVEARDLERVGVEPFVFKVLRVSASDTAPPVVDNRTQSVAAAVTDFTAKPLPRATVTLTNLSAKRVRAVTIKTTLQGRPRIQTLAFEPDGRPLMEPGGTYERKIDITYGRASGSSFTPESIDSVVIAAAVFEDYTFEGDPESAAQKLYMDEGSRLQLPRLVQLLRDAQGGADAETAGAVRALRASLNVLDDTAPRSSVDALLAAHPALPPSVGNTPMGDRLKVGIEVSMHYVRTELLKDLARFEKKFRAAPADNSFRRWLAGQQARYENWLARL